MSNQSDVDPLTVAEDVNAFMLSDLGKRYIESLEGKYRDCHSKAEIENMTNEQRAYYVTYAAGIRFAMDWFKLRKQAYDNGAYDKK